MTGDVMSVSRLRMGSDGKGISTLVAMYGCPLHCKYCINDACHEIFIELPDFMKKYDKEPVYKKEDRSDTPRALYKPEELVKVLRKDEIYYLMTGGGIVFGGGEPLLQSAFIHEVCQLADDRWEKRMETSLNVPWENVEPLVEDLDEWIIDIKDMDPAIYKDYTGSNNEKVLDNLLKLRDVLKPEMFRIRIPRIRGYNTDEHVEESVLWIRRNIWVEPEVFDYYSI